MAEKIEIVAELKDLVSGHLKDITSQVDRLDGKLSSVGAKGVSGIMGQVLGANLLTGAIQKAGSALFDFGKDSLDAFGQQEQFLVSLRTMFHGNEKEAETLNSKLLTLAKTTPFELTEIQEATKMMIAYGSTSGGVIKELKTLGDVSSGVGASVKDIAYLYGTLRTQGRAYSVDIRQFAGRGIPIIHELAKQFKIADTQVMKYVEDGKVGFKDVEAAFASMTAKGGQFFGMMDEQSKTQVGQLSNLSDAWNQFKAGLGENLSTAFKGAISVLTQGLNELSGFVQDYNKSARLFEKKGLDFKFLEGNESRGESAALSNYLKGVQEYGAKGEKESGLAKRGIQDYINKLAVDFKTESNLASVNKEKGPDALKFLREVTQLKDAISGIDQDAKSRKAEKDKTAKQPANLETLAKANRQSVTNINIENLVREINAVYQGTSEAAKMSIADFSKMLSKALLGVVNDISVIQN